jgi:hypothetical protein
MPRPEASAIPAANCACAFAMTFSDIMRCASLAATAPPAASRIIRNAITHWASAPKLAAASQAFKGFRT